MRHLQRLGGIPSSKSRPAPCEWMSFATTTPLVQALTRPAPLVAWAFLRPLLSSIRACVALRVDAAVSAVDTLAFVGRGVQLQREQTAAHEGLTRQCPRSP
jgi:hypothetical protein